MLVYHVGMQIKTTVVGSYPCPVWLPGSKSGRLALRDAVMVVLKTQELAGIDVISDGELSRFDPAHPETNGMIDYFIGQMGGISTRLTQDERREFRKQPGMGFRRNPAAVVRGEITAGTLDLEEQWHWVMDLTRKPLKFTVTSPFMLAKTLLDRHYPNLDELCMAIAEVLRKQLLEINADVVQVDEANLPGHPDGAAIAARAINHLLSGAKGSKGVHLCFGNYGGQTVQKGFWENLLNFFNSLNCDHLVLEFARRGYEELEVFKELKPDMTLGVGVIDIKDNQVESAETVARRIEKAINLLGEQRIQWVHPDCGFWMLPRSVADAKMAALVKGRNLVQGQ